MSTPRAYYPVAKCALSVVLTGEADDVSHTVWAYPKQLTVTKNPDSKADTMSATFDFRDMPFLPSQIRACEVACYMYQTGDAVTDPHVPDEQRVGTKPSNDGAPTGVAVGDIAEVRARGTWPIFYGRAAVKYENSDSGAWLMLEGLDYTDYFAKRQWKPNPNGSPRRVPVGKRLDEWLADIVAEVDPRRQFRIATDGIEASELPVVGKGLSTGVSKGFPVKEDTKYWDVIHKICARHGFSVYVDSLFVVIKRTAGVDEKSRRMVFAMEWGENIKALSASTEIANDDVPDVILAGYDAKTKKTIYGEWPVGARARKASGKKGEFAFYEVPIVDEALLKRTAKEYYEHKKRGARPVVVTTKDIRDQSGQDLLRMKSDDLMTIGFDPYDATNLSQLSGDDERASALRRRGINFRVADYIAKNFYRLSATARPFVVNEVEFAFDVSTGLEIKTTLAEAFLVDRETAGRNEKAPSRRGVTR